LLVAQCKSIALDLCGSCTRRPFVTAGLAASVPRLLGALVAPIAATIVVAAMLVGVQPARADIGIESVSRTSGFPGEPVDLLVACGGCLPCTVRLPVSLLPVGSSPGRRSPTAPESPASAPYVPLGNAVPLAGGARLASRLGLEIPNAVERRRAGALRAWVASTNRLRFRIPNAEPGLYSYVVYCEGCQRGPGGSLITNTGEQRELLRIRATGEPTGAGPVTIWLIVAAGVVLLLALAGLTLRRR
jgi:hypothetical protein